MQRGWIERLKEREDEELLRFTERKGIISLSAAQELIKRIREGKIKEERRYLRKIVKNLRISEGSKKLRIEAEEVFNETAKLVIEKGLDEESLSNILRKANENIKERAGRKWLRKEEGTNYSLREIIANVSSLREIASERLLGQNPSKDDLYFIVMEGKGKPQKKAWNLLKEKGMPIDDACTFIQLKDELALPTWQMLKEEGRIEEIEIEDLEEIFKYTSYPEIRQETIEELWFKRKKEILERFEKKDEVGKEALELIMDNAKMIRGENSREVENEIERILYYKKPSSISGGLKKV